MERVTLGLRPTPDDGLPAIGLLPGVAGLCVAVMHSGITLAPAVGRGAAMELLDGAEVELLAPSARIALRVADSPPRRWARRTSPFDKLRTRRNLPHAEPVEA